MPVGTLWAGAFRPQSEGGSAALVGGQGCAPMGPVVSDPPQPQQVFLTAGEHILFIDATTNDALYHFVAFYQFDLSFEAV